MSVDTTLEAPPRVVDDAPLTLADLFAQRFPSPDLVCAAGALFASPGRWSGSELGRRFFLEVTGGTLTLRATDPARNERAGNDSLGSFDAYAARHLGRYRRDQLPSVQDLHTGPKGYAPFLDVVDPGPGTRSAHREVTVWSAKSRRRMVKRLAEYDYAPLIRQGTPAMLTLTYPGEWLSVAPNGKAVKRHLALLQKRWATRWGSRPVGPWKLEFQGRGAPHIHVWTVPPAEPRIVGRATLLPDRDFASWLSDTWADIVNHADPVHRARHHRAGTAVDYAEGTRYADPRRLARYFAGHSLKHADGKEYQHVLPESWRQPGDGPGRWWGAWGLSVARTTVELDFRAFLAARRTLRRLSRSQGLSRPVVVDRVNTRTGVVFRRRVNRRLRPLLSTSGLVGGWLLLNDAPAAASTLSRHPVGMQRPART